CERRPGVADHGPDLGTVADDAGVGQQPGLIPLVELGHRRWVEPAESGAEAGPLAQDGEPGQARLESLKRQPLEHPGVVAYRLAPFLVVVGEVVGRSQRPGAAQQPVGPGRGAAAGPDGLLRCPWALGTADYLAYHDEEWGQPVRDDAGMFERLSLEAFQSGLSWLTILRKRPGFRAAFSGFDPAAVAEFDEGDEARLLADPGIIRNRAKIRAVIGNARAALTVPGGLAALVWRYHGQEPSAAPVTTADVPPWTSASRACARELRAAGFSFVGPVTVYSTMQACGIVDDHLTACFRRIQRKNN